MGTKRRSMFNPKFKTVRPKRWEQGRKILGIPTETEIQAEKLAEEQEAIRLQAEQEAKVKLEAEIATKQKIEVEQAKIKLEEETTAQQAKIAATQSAKPKAKTKAKPKSTKARRTRAKKE